MIHFRLSKFNKLRINVEYAVHLSRKPAASCFTVSSKILLYVWTNAIKNLQAIGNHDYVDWLGNEIIM